MLKNVAFLLRLAAIAAGFTHSTMADECVAESCSSSSLAPICPRYTATGCCFKDCQAQTIQMSGTAPAEYSGDSNGEESMTIVCGLAGAYCEFADSDLGEIYDTVNFLVDARTLGLTASVRTWVRGKIKEKLRCSAEGAICGSSSAVGAPAATSFVIASCLATFLL